MDVLFDSLQVEVDSPKFSTRYSDYYPDLNRRLDSEAFALPFFDFKQDDRVFNSAPMPVAKNDSVVDLYTPPHQPDLGELRVKRNAR